MNDDTRSTYVGAPWRNPDEESTDLYPGLVVDDGRVSGSITVGRSRLPLWAFVGWLPDTGWSEVVRSWDYIEADPPDGYGWTAEKMGEFLHCLMELRGEFGRLLLVLADAERCERKRGGWGKAWWETKKHRKRVIDQLRRCINALEAENDAGDTTNSRRPPAPNTTPQPPPTRRT